MLLRIIKFRLVQLCNVDVPKMYCRYREKVIFRICLVKKLSYMKIYGKRTERRGQKGGEKEIYERRRKQMMGEGQKGKEKGRED